MSVSAIVRRAAGSLDGGPDFTGFHTVFDLSKQTGYVDSDPIGTLTDQTGNGRDATSTGTARPLYRTDLGFPVARFNGSNVLQTATFTPVAQPSTYVCLVKTSGGTGARAIVTSTASNYQAIYHQSTTWRSYAGSVLTGPAFSTSWAVVVSVFNGASSKIYVNGGTASTGNPGAGDVEGFIVGGISSQRWLGDTNFIGMYRGILPTANLTQLNQIGQALATRAGISWTAIT